MTQLAEWQRWLLGIGALLATALVVFMLIVFRNPEMFLMGTVLVIFQVAFSCAVISVFGGISFAIANSVLQAIRESEARIREAISAVQRTILAAARSFGADLLSVIAGLLVYLVQEMLGGYLRVYRISISVLLTLNFFLASQLIGSERGWRKALGVFFFVVPVVTFFAPFAIFTPHEQFLRWIDHRGPGELLMMGAAIVASLLTFAFAFLKRRRSA